MAGRAPRTPNVTPSIPLPQVHNLASAIPGAVKNAQDAKAYLFASGWCLPGETVALDTLARTLFSVVVDGKLASKHANAISAVAFLITERLEDKIIQSFTDKLTDLAKSTVDTLAVDLHDRLEQQIQSISETFQVNNTLTENLTTLTQNLQQTQERFESTQQSLTNTRSYSQVAASSPTTNHLTPQVSLAQVQIRNREGIKKKQVLIDFTQTADLDLDFMDQTTLARKVNDAINVAWAATPDPDLTRPKIKDVTLMRNGGLLLEFDSEQSANWLKREDISKRVLDNIGSGARIKNRSYQVIVQFVPVTFDPVDDTQLRAVETANGLDPKTILKAEWIKKPEDRKLGQKVATLRLYLKDAKSANEILLHGAHIHGKKISPKKPKKEPIRCLRCQRFGHERRDCKSETPKCALCSNHHETNDCQAPKELKRCANCLGPHPAYDRECPRFWEKCRQTDARCPENNLAFYPTDVQDWSWATLEQDARADPPPNNRLPPPSDHPGGLRQTTLTGANRTNLSFRTSSQQPHPSFRP